MPRKAAVTVEEVVQSLKKIISCLASPKLPPYSSGVWGEISVDLKTKWTAHDVYNNVVQNRRNILTLARSEKGVIVLEDSTLNESTAFDGSVVDSDEDHENDEPLFTVHHTSEEWSAIKPKIGLLTRDKKRKERTKPPAKKKVHVLEA